MSLDEDYVLDIGEVATHPVISTVLRMLIDESQEFLLGLFIGHIIYNRISTTDIDVIYESQLLSYTSQDYNFVINYFGDTVVLNIYQQKLEGDINVLRCTAINAKDNT